MSTPDPVRPPWPQLLAAAVVVVAAILLIADWRSSIRLVTSSSNLNHALFSAMLIGLPLVLICLAQRLRSNWKWSFRVVAMVFLVPAAPIAILNASSTISMITSGWQFDPLVAEIAFRVDRIAAYQVETFPAGYYTRVTREHSVFLGLMIARDLAYLGSIPPPHLAILAPEDLIVSIPADAATPKEFRIHIPKMVGLGGTVDVPN